MEITINGKPADITLENEKTLGELLSGIYSWLEGSGQVLSGLELDGTVYGSASIEAVFDRSLDTASRIDIKTSPWAALMLEALLGLKNDLEFLSAASGKAGFGNASGSGVSPAEWDSGGTALFLKKNDPELRAAALEVLEGRLKPEAALPLLDERIRELRDPLEAVRSSIPLAEDAAKRLEDLPLDLQTGKDARAAETIALFTAISEKLFRLFFYFRQSGLAAGESNAFFAEFARTIREFHAAYESGDTVLVGDLAEYEIAPRLLELASRLETSAVEAEHRKDGAAGALPEGNSPLGPA